MGWPGLDLLSQRSERVWLGLGSVQRWKKAQEEGWEQGTPGAYWSPEVEGRGCGQGWPSPWLQGLGLPRTVPNHVQSTRDSGSYEWSTHTRVPWLSRLSEVTEYNGDGQSWL